MKSLERAKKLLRSRDLFSNWLSLGLRYLVSRDGRDLIARCRDGGSVDLSPRAYSAIVRLHAAGYLNRLDCRSGEASLCGIDLVIDHLGGEFYWLADPIFCNALKEGIDSGRVRREKDAWFVNGVRFKELRLGIIETFLMGHWILEGIDIRGREVVDIGAYVGDTPLYFIYNGARRVVAVEPHPIAFKEMVENIKLNNASEKIMAINAAIGSSRGSTKIPANIPLWEIEGVSALNSRSGGIEIPVLRLEDIIDHIGDHHLIKLDCEGCEHEILKSSLDTLKKFEVIYLEYHGGYEYIVKKLENSYRCRHTGYELTEDQRVLLCVRT